LHQKPKIAFFLQRKVPTFQKWTFYFCPFFQSAPISFSDFYYLWDMKSGNLR
jgi:hypothetical protein